MFPAAPRAPVAVPPKAVDFKAPPPLMFPAEIPEIPVMLPAAPENRRPFPET